MSLKLLRRHSAHKVRSSCMLSVKELKQANLMTKFSIVALRLCISISVWIILAELSMRLALHIVTTRRTSSNFWLSCYIEVWIQKPLASSVPINELRHRKQFNFRNMLHNPRESCGWLKLWKFNSVTSVEGCLRCDMLRNKIGSIWGAPQHSHLCSVIWWGWSRLGNCLKQANFAVSLNIRIKAFHINNKIQFNELIIKLNFVAFDSH